MILVILTAYQELSDKIRLYVCIRGVISWYISISYTSMYELYITCKINVIDNVVQSVYCIIYLAIGEIS